MGLALEAIVAQGTNVGAGPTNMAAVAQSTLVVRNARLDSRVLLLTAWADMQFTGFVQIRSPKLHDNVRGLRLSTVAGEVVPLLPEGTKQPLVPQDGLVVEGSAADAAGDLETAVLLVFYEDLAGTAANLITPAELDQRSLNLESVNATLTAGAGGGFTGEEAINAESDLLKANTDYALVGYEVTVECAGVFWRGVDSGNLRVGGPGEPTIREKTRSWFVDLARAYNLPMIPVFNSANRGGILTDVAQDENAAAVVLTSLFVELTPKR